MKALLIPLAALLYALGWVAGLVALMALWCWSALAVGWDDARQLAQRPADARKPVKAR